VIVQRRESTADMLARTARTAKAREKAAGTGDLELSDLADLEPSEILGLVESGRLANHGIGASKRRGRR
jgi:hypothetical protein